MLRRSLILAALLLSPGTGSAGDVPEAKQHAIVARLDPAVLAGPAPLAAPMILPATIGIPKVITWANTAGTSGIAWGSTSAIVAGNAYVTYNATDMLLNVPTGDGFSFLVNNVQVIDVSSTGAVTLTSSLTFSTASVNQIFTTSLLWKDNAGNTMATLFDAGAVGQFRTDHLEAAVHLHSDSIVPYTASGTITFTNNGGVIIDGTADVVQLTVQGNATQTTLPFVVENSAGGDVFTVSNTGDVVATGAFSSTYSSGAPDFIVAILRANATDARLSYNNDGDVSSVVASATGLVLTGADGLGSVSTFSLLGTSATLDRPLLIDGGTDAVQLTVQGNATQTTLPFVVENSGGTDVATISNLGAMVLSSSLTVTGDGNFSDDLFVGDAGTFTGDLTLNGGVGALGFGTGETIVPADGTLNVTGDFAASGDIYVTGNDLEVSTGVEGRIMVSFGGLQNTLATPFQNQTQQIGWINTGANRYRASIGDSGTAIAHQFEANADFATAGSKIASFGDNAGTSYAEKAYIDYTGLGSFSGGVNFPNSAGNVVGLAGSISGRQRVTRNEAQALFTAGTSAGVATPTQIIITTGSASYPYTTSNNVRGIAVGDTWQENGESLSISAIDVAAGTVTITGGTFFHPGGTYTLSTVSSSVRVADFADVDGLITAIAAKTAAYTVTDVDYTLTGDPTTASFTFTLPTAVGRAGKRFNFKKLTASANTVTIDGSGAETIDGAATLVISTQNTTREIQSNGANWIVYGGLGAL